MESININHIPGDIFDVVLKQDGRDRGVIGITRSELANRLSEWMINYRKILIVPETSEVGDVTKYVFGQA